MEYYLRQIRTQLEKKSESWYIAQRKFYKSMRNLYLINDRVKLSVDKAYITVKQFSGPKAAIMQARKYADITSEK